MSQYKQRISFERLLIKKINSWFKKATLCGLSQDSLNRWISSTNINRESSGVIKLLNISERLKALANRSQEIVDPSIPIELTDLKAEIIKLNKKDFD